MTAKRILETSFNSENPEDAVDKRLDGSSGSRVDGSSRPHVAVAVLRSPFPWMLLLPTSDRDAGAIIRDQGRNKG